MAVRDRGTIRRAFVPHRRQSSVLVDRSGLVLDEQVRTASYDGIPVDLSERQFGLLLVLVSNPGRLVTPYELGLHAWGEEQSSSETVRSAVKAVRARLRAAGAPTEDLATVWGLGYRWDGLLVENSSQHVEIAS
jgi:DNA-binding response OmpR family regulator